MWELLIDNAFGISDKDEYFPKAKWKKIDSSVTEQVSSNLRPDTIMKIQHNDDYDLYVLDAKYYGLYDDGTNRLPATADINKQITYGKVVEIIDGLNEPYNAFLLPSSNIENFSCDRYATIEELTDYEDKRFGKVLAVYCNVKNMMQYLYRKAPKKDIENLSELIKSNYLKIVERNGKNNYDYSNDVVKKATNIITTEIDKISKKSLAANIDLKIFEPIYKRLDKLFRRDNQFN